MSVLDDLRELDFGELEGRSFEEIRVLQPDLYEDWMPAPTTVRFPGGERYDDLHARVADAVSGLRTSYAGRTMVAVTHDGVVRAVLAEALGLPQESIFRLAVDTGSIRFAKGKRADRRAG